MLNEYYVILIIRNIDSKFIHLMEILLNRISILYQRHFLLVEEVVGCCILGGAFLARLENFFLKLVLRNRITHGIAFSNIRKPIILCISTTRINVLKRNR